MKLAWKKRKHIKARIRCVVSFFVFCQANLILVPFSAHCQQVPFLYPGVGVTVQLGPMSRGHGLRRCLYSEVQCIMGNDHTGPSC